MQGFECRAPRGLRLMMCVVGAALLAGCTANPKMQLEQVAKDWSMTIRASQVVPVYPLSEDVQPGDVFLVPTSIGDQVRIYEEKGFLPIDQLVTRLSGLKYGDFYADSFWKGDYAAAPHTRPTGTGGGKINAPRAAFPSYTFSVDNSGGLKLALPIQGIPFGLGLMGAAKAAGTVTLSDAYTYGTTGEIAYTRLLAWYQSNPEIKSTFAAMAGSAKGGIFLRVVTRVYLTGEVDVSLVNGSANAAGIDGGAAQNISLLNMTGDQATKLKDGAKLHGEVLSALSAALNGNAVGMPGGSVRLTQVTQRAVGMKQKFDRPLVIGFAGFDVKVDANGVLSAPIPSFSVLSGETKDEAFKPIPFSDDGGLSNAYIGWLATGGNRQKMIQFLKEQGVTNDPADLAYNAQLRSVLRAAQKKFGF